MYKDGAPRRTLDGRPEYRCSQNVIAASEKFARRGFIDRIVIPSPVGADANGVFEWELPKNSHRFFFGKITT